MSSYIACTHCPPRFCEFFAHVLRDLPRLEHRDSVLVKQVDSLDAAHQDAHSLNLVIDESSSQCRQNVAIQKIIQALFLDCENVCFAVCEM